ncbi:MAG: methyltransferase domain-containing protein [Spirochaetes bacterium]|nr:methyltransferase domain-containing protein [Spirochaetota bacterium]
MKMIRRSTRANKKGGARAKRPSARASGLSPADLAAVYDELPLWSAPFAAMLLEQVDLKDGLRFLDVGCATGVPLLELAQRIHRHQAYGIDPWAEALGRLREKAAQLGVSGITLKNAAAEKLPFAAGFFDLAVSNNGLNNVADLPKALSELARVLKGGGRLVFTANLPETMHEYYDALRFALRQAGRTDLDGAIEAHIASKRKPVDGWKKALLDAGFKVEGVEKGRFFQYYSSAAALYSHSFIRQNFLPAWRELLPEALRERILAAAGKRLDELAAVHRGVRLTIPMACFVASKQGG